MMELVDEQELLATLESRLEAKLSAFMEVGEILSEIMEKRLYRHEYATFEDYVEGRWDLGKRQAHRILSAHETSLAIAREVNGTELANNKHVKICDPVGHFSEPAEKPIVVLPKSERQVRPLTKLPKDERTAAWKEAVENDGGQPTAKTIERVVAAKRDNKRDKDKEKSDNPETKLTCVVEDSIDDFAEATAAPEPTPVLAPVIPPEPTDEEWVQSLHLYKRLAGQQRDWFVEDALAYRKMEPTIRRDAEEARAKLPKPKKGERQPPFLYRAWRWARSEHPRHWNLCPGPEDGGCNGTGVRPVWNDTCLKCRGAGYFA